MADTMTEAQKIGPEAGVTPNSAATPPKLGLLARLGGVIFSPRQTFASIVAYPKWFGAMAVAVLITAVGQFALLSTDVGKQLALDQQVAAMEAFGQTVSDEAYANLEQGMERARYISPVLTIFATPLFTAMIAGLMHLVFGLIGGGNGTFRQVYAVNAHTGIFGGLLIVFTTLVTVAAGRPAGADLSVFVPTLEESTFIYRFLSTINFFYVWSLFVTAIGLGVLYKRRTGPIAMVLFGIYLVIALIIGFVRSGS
jgi:Yip1-like protein